MEELYKDIKGYEGLYQISNLGNVINKNGKKKKLTKNADGYLRVSLSKNNKKKWFFVHRLVAEAFIPNQKELPFVNHRDELKTNNCVSNLEWCNSKYNNSYGTRLERFSKSISKQIYQYDFNGELIKIWKSVTEAKNNGFNETCIVDCCNGKQKSHAKYIWSYKPLQLTAEELEDIKKSALKRYSKKVYQRDLNGNIVKIWESTSECRKNGFYNIPACCNDKHKTAYGYKWSYN